MFVPAHTTLMLKDSAVDFKVYTSEEFRDFIQITLKTDNSKATIRFRFEDVFVDEEDGNCVISAYGGISYTDGMVNIQSGVNDDVDPYYSEMSFNCSPGSYEMIVDFINNLKQSDEEDSEQD